MPIPEFDADGFLPDGIHDCSWAELRNRFGSFQRSDRRAHLYLQLEEFASELRTLGHPFILLVNGSFVTSRPEPNDVDFILVLPETWSFRAELTPQTYSLLSKTYVKRRWTFDMLVAAENTKEYHEYVEFFQRVRYRRDRRKGIVRIRV